MDGSPHVVDGLHVEQDTDYAVRTVLRERVGAVIVLSDEGCLSHDVYGHFFGWRRDHDCGFQGGFRDLGSVRVVEVAGRSCFGRSVGLALAFSPSFTA